MYVIFIMLFKGDIMHLQSVKGIGPILEKKLNNLEIYSVNDLLEYYPYKYNFIKIININDIKENENCMINAMVIENASVQYIKRNLNQLTFRAISDDISFNVVIFNRAFLKPNIILGKNVVLSGKYNFFKKLFTASDIKFNVLNNSIEPVYHLTEGVSNNVVKKCINEVLNINNFLDKVPDKYNNEYKFISKITALNKIHNPKSIKDIKEASLKLKYEELFEFMFKINYLKQLNDRVLGIKRDITKKEIKTFINSLKFTLTKDQEESFRDIYNDLISEKRMNRLILGDVGSGKTIIAVFAIYLNFLSGYQSAFMAPTEILAEQHFKSIKLDLAKFNLNIALLTGSTKSREKEKIYQDLESGKINLIIGTHALITDKTKFKKLGLVVVDEQHRFGVDQRNNLRDKGVVTDVMYLSATPIPRTYALTIYGDLDLSLIKTKPLGRKDIITKVVKENNIKEVLYKMLDELKQNHQIFIVSPLIDNNEELNLKSVIELKEKILMAFNNQVSVEIIHGRLKQKEKDEIMNKFKNGNIKILISTTVIEVGIDIPNATMMVIYNAERFGLATLHQLRGRVGRNDIQSYCYLISNMDIERLKVLEESNDGFYISEKDFQMRGQGDLFGVKQSGDLTFKIANLKNDYDILLQAKKDSFDYLTSKDYLNSAYYLELTHKIDFID